MNDSGPATPWHVDSEALRRWMDGAASLVVSTSVEQHLVRCEHCRSQVADLAPLPVPESVWGRVLDEVEAPRVGVLPRLLMQLHLSPGDAVVVATTPALRLPWLAALAAMLVFSVVAAVPSGGVGLTLFLIVAPLAPLLGVAAAYGPSSDPSFELAVSTPYSMPRLVLVRTAAVLLACAPLSVLAGLLLPSAGSVAVAWLLPAGGFVMVLLAVSAWADPVLAAGAVSGGWLLAVLLAAHAERPLDVIRPEALVGYVAVTAVAVLALFLRLRRPAPAWPIR